MITYQTSPPLSNQALNTLFQSAWPNHAPHDIVTLLQHCKLWICAYDSVHLIGFVKVLSDGGKHGFILDTTVHVDYQHQGIGKELLNQSAIVSRKMGMQWLHADFEPQHEHFYRESGFTNTRAGVLKL